ncbi:MAG: hypothetical protein QGH74_05430 [Candidatus Brocadiia bacterium]|jgi:hypothetical protein|nr:hypothetical protein [Candidatus Brocadiia bacterium]
MRTPDRIKRLEHLVDPPWWKFSFKPRSSEFAAMQLWKSGPQALPFLLKTLEGPDDVRRKAVLAALNRIGPADADTLPALMEAYQAQTVEPIGRAIARLGPGAASAIPALMKMLREADPETQAGIMDAMAGIGQAGLRGFRHALLDAGIAWPVRLKACESLADLGRHARRGVDALLMGLKDHYSQVRHAAATGMEAAEMGSVRDVMKVLKDDGLSRLRLSYDDLRALMLIKRMHSSDSDELASAGSVMADHQGAADAVWRFLEKTLTYNPDEFGDTTLTDLSTEMLIYRLLVETGDRVRAEYVTELGRRRASWVAALLKRLSDDATRDETFRYACQEVAGWI